MPFRHPRPYRRRPARAWPPSTATSSTFGTVICFPHFLQRPCLPAIRSVDVELRPAALTEKHDAHQADSFITGQAHACSIVIAFTSVSRQKIATNIPRSSSVQKMTPSSNLAISLK